MTVAGIATAVLFFLLSFSKPVQELSAERPQSRVLSLYMFLSIIGQFAVHLFVIFSTVAMAKPLTVLDAATKDPDGEFHPNILNSVVFLVSTSMNVATFLANYQGRPFMQSLQENRQLRTVLVGTEVFLFALLFGIVPSLNGGMQMTPFPSDEFRLRLASYMAFDLVVSVLYAKIVHWLFAIRPRPQQTQQVQASKAGAAGKPHSD